MLRKVYMRRDNTACFLGLPVSTTHTTVGAVVGMALVLQGSSAVMWHTSSSTFPFYKGARLLPVLACLQIDNPFPLQAGPHSDWTLCMQGLLLSSPPG
jgi:hypothetical protein